VYNLKLYIAPFVRGSFHSLVFACKELHNKGYYLLTHYCGRVTQICVFNTVKLGTSVSSP